MVLSFVWTLGGWVVGDGSVWMFHQIGSKSSAGHVQIGGLAEGSPTGCSHGSATKDSAAAAVSSVCGTVCSEVGRLEEFLQCENERLLTPSEQRRQRESAGCRRPSTVWECGSQEGIGVGSCQSTEAGGGPTHAPDRRDSRVHRKGQEENSSRRREDPSCRASRGRSEGGEGVRFARTPVGRVPFRASAGRGTSPCIVPCVSSDLISDATGEQLQAERDSFAQMLTQQRVARGEEMQAKKFLREDFLPGCVEELVEWMGCRQQETNDAAAPGRDSNVTRLSGALAEGAMQQ